jgi:hypothetical protein
MEEYEFDEPLRLRILKALTAALLEITIENGYRHDLGPSEQWPNGRVFRGRVVFGAKDPLPMVAILETPLQPEDLPPPPDSELFRGDWDLTIQGYVEDDLENPTDPAHYLAADVIRRLAVEKKKNTDFNLFGMGDDIINLRIGVPVVRPPDELSAKAYFWLPVALELTENLEKPYGEKVA